MLPMASKTDTHLSKPQVDYAEVSIAIVGGLALALIAMFLCVVSLTGKAASGRDFVVYWATGQQLAHHANPYDTDALGRIEHTAGLPAVYGVLYMRNPPWDLILTLPLGFIGLRIAALLWSLILAGCLVACVRMLWIMHGRPPNRLHWLGYSFAPAMVCLFAGQTSLFALVGLVLFLRLHATRPFLAGASLWLCALKPHLFLAFGVVLLAWMIASRSYRILAGGMAAIAASCGLVYFVDPMAWTQYFQMIRKSGIDKEIIPCLGVALRTWINPNAAWIPYVLPALACVWALGYFFVHRRTWSWMNEGSLVMLVSIVMAPYCWMFDQSLAVPALLQGAYAARSRVLLTVLAFVSVAIQIALVAKVRINSPFYLLIAPVWLAWYLLAIRTKGGSRAGQPAS